VLSERLLSGCIMLNSLTLVTQFIGAILPQCMPMFNQWIVLLGYSIFFFVHNTLCSLICLASRRRCSIGHNQHQREMNFVISFFLGSCFVQFECFMTVYFNGFIQCYNRSLSGSNLMCVIIDRISNDKNQFDLAA